MNKVYFILADLEMRKLEYQQELDILLVQAVNYNFFFELKIQK